MTAITLVLFQVALMASWSPSPVEAFAGVQTFQRKAPATTVTVNRESRAFHPATTNTLSLGAKSDDEEEEDGDPLMNDQREGMSNAFSALDSLTADDFDDLRPMSSTANEGSSGSSTSDPNMEMSAKLYMEMQAELSTKGEEGVYGDILGDLTGDNPGVDAPQSYLNTEGGDATGLGQALDNAADLLAADATAAADTSVLYDADGLGSPDTSTDYPYTPLTTADVSNDILTQDIQPSLSMEEFMKSAMQEAVEEMEVTSEMASMSEPGRTTDIAKTAEQLLEDEELRKDIDAIFDRAGEKLKLEVEAMRREQDAVTQAASQRGLDYLESEKQRISEAEASVSRMIQKVAKETESVQLAMEDLETVKNDASGEGSGLIDLKKGGIVKQAALVGALLLGSRAVTETILVVGSPYGDQHFVPAILQGVIALACAAYFFLVK